MLLLSIISLNSSPVTPYKSSHLGGTSLFLREFEKKIKEFKKNNTIDDINLNIYKLIFNNNYRTMKRASGWKFWRVGWSANQRVSKVDSGLLGFAKLHPSLRSCVLLNPGKTLPEWDLRQGHDFQCKVRHKIKNKNCDLVGSNPCQ